ncbi:MAG: hydroxymethylpyrimidine/phosphomethylpyrimidine kinase [Steroidobacteraceae bacterium]|nr:hydroxymethylpyrimidine/phosphomethylpyrimidine kinase [Steroidobacteraceae bacterium]
MTTRQSVLLIGGTDSSGGAGLARDWRVLADCKIAGSAVVTAVTAQSNTGVRAIQHVPPEMIRAQMECALQSESGEVRAVKVGMLGTAATVRVIAAALRARSDLPVILDPVIAASSGGRLLDDRGLEVLRSELLPRVTLITPNIPEAAALLGEPTSCEEGRLIEFASRIREMGPRAVLIKGGHASSAECVDILLSPEGAVTRLVSGRIPASMRGSGCALASAIAVGLARSLPLVDACRFGKDYVTSELHAIATGNSDHVR